MNNIIQIEEKWLYLTKTNKNIYKLQNEKVTLRTFESLGLLIIYNKSLVMFY